MRGDAATPAQQSETLKERLLKEARRLRGEALLPPGLPREVGSTRRSRSIEQFA
jgi:hypothetical protein